MSLSTTDIEELAQVLDTAQTTCADTPSLSDTHTFDLDDAYEIQSALIKQRQARGEQIVGVKLGFTSKAKMAQMGVCEVIVGRLTDAMRIADGAEVDLGRFIHPKAEPEIAYRLCRDVPLDDPAADIESCVDAVAPAIEIIDSRYRDFRFTHPDVVADNTSAAGFLVGAWRCLQSVTNRSVRLTVGSNQVLGSTAAILGDPVRALHALLHVARHRRIPLRAGQIVLAGAATAAVELTPGVTECRIAGVGFASMQGTMRPRPQASKG